ncbi:hypothetical protein K1T71_003774 [Dendrolimus kikuchii]|uniref:Uncharacterized protein n=1 Tax=Dendrolimus kikuchii TaxID=765133 RepID=A0ACC1D915_9NEOP|nr:hypothetical protein K1T71_003774 [Dendrolimus kikuchii]
MTKLSQDIMWNPRAKFIVYLSDYDNTDMGDIFDIFLLHKMYRIVLIKDEINGTMLYSYLPFADDNCGIDFVVSEDLIHVGECTEVDTVECFPETHTEKLSNCRFRVVASEDVPNFIFETKNYVKGGKFIQGLEQYVLETFEEKEHVFIDYIVVPDKTRFGVVLPNGTATGLLSCLQHNQADIAAGGFILMKNRIDMFDFICCYNFAAFNVFTPAFEKNAWEDVYKEFSTITWILIFISYCSITIIIKQFSRNKYDRTYLMLRLWGYLVGNINSKFSRPKGIKFIMIVWIVFTFFICSFYNTALYSLITRYDHVLRHISDEQLSNLPYKPCISEATRTYFLFAFNQTLPDSQSYEECMYSESSLGFIASRKDLYGIEMEYTYTLHEYKYIDDNGNIKLDTWRFSINNVISLYVTRGFAFLVEIQHYARQMFETGLLMNQLEKIHRSIGPIIPRYTKQFKKVSILDLRVHFAILLLGSLMATILLIFEIWRGKKKLNERKISTANIRFTH